MEVTDGRLVKLCKQNKKDGYNLLFEKYHRYIYSLCFHYIRSKDDSLDLVQELFMKVFKSLDGFKEDRPLIPWIRRISVNTCLNYIRDNRQQGELSLNSDIDEEYITIGDMVSSAEDTEKDVLYKDTKRILEDAVSTLPDEIRMAFVLRHVKELSYNEISEVMSLPLGTVKTYIFKGRRMVKDILKDEGILEV